MGRAPCCEKTGLKKGPWSAEEDEILISYIHQHGHPNWRALPKQSGLLRCGKSCRLRWVNYLSPSIRRGNFSPEEEDAIIKLHEIMGNRWSAIAAKLPGRTDNEIKNIWHTHLKKRLNNQSSNNSTNESHNSQEMINANEDSPNPPDHSQINSTNGGGFIGNHVRFYPQSVESPQNSINTTTSSTTGTTNTTTTTTSNTITDGSTCQHQDVSVSTSLAEVSESSSGFTEMDESFWWQNLLEENIFDFDIINSSSILSPPGPPHPYEFGFGFGFEDQQQLQQHHSVNNGDVVGGKSDFWYGVFIGAGGGSSPEIQPDF